MPRTKQTGSERRMRSTAQLKRRDLERAEVQTQRDAERVAMGDPMPVIGMDRDPLVPLPRPQ